MSEINWDAFNQSLDEDEEAARLDKGVVVDFGGSTQKADTKPPAVDFDAFNESLDQSTTAAAELSLGSAIGEDPDRAARANVMAAEEGLPPELVESDPDAYARRQTMRNSLEAIEDAPGTTQFLSDPENAKVAHDDVDNLTAYERMMINGYLEKPSETVAIEAPTSTRTDYAKQMAEANLDAFEGIPRAYNRGVLLHELGYLGVALRHSPGDPAILQAIKENQAKTAALGHAGEGAFSLLEEASELVGQMWSGMATPEMAASIGAGAVVGSAAGLAGGPLAPVTSPAGALIGAGAGAMQHMGMDTFYVESGLSYIEQLESGIDPEVAAYTSLGVGVINAGLELGGVAIVAIPMRAATKKMFDTGLKEAMKSATVLGAIKTFGLTYGAGVFGETGTEVAQEAVNIAAEEIGKEFSEGDFESITQEEITERLTLIAVKVFKAMVVLGLPGAGANFAMDVKAAGAAKDNRELFEAMGSNAEASKLRARLPAKYREFIEAVQARAAEEGHDIENIYVDPKAIQTLMQDGKIDDLVDVIPQLGQGAIEGLATGSKVAVPLADYQTHIAGTGLGQALMGDITMLPDGMTSKEADRANAEIADIMNAEYEAAMADFEAGKKLDEPFQRVFDAVEKQLIATGMSPDAARTDAEIAVANARAFSARYPEWDVAKAFGNLQIKGAIPESIRNPVEPLDLLIEAARRGVPEGSQDLLGESLQEFARRHGINDGGEELAGLDEGLKPFQAAMLREGGESADRVRELAIEAGYFPTGGPEYASDFMELLNGDPLYLEGGGNPDAAGRVAAAEDLIETLHRLNIDLDAPNAEIKAALDAAMAEEDGGVPTNVAIPEGTQIPSGLEMKLGGFVGEPTTASLAPLPDAPVREDFDSDTDFAKARAVYDEIVAARPAAIAFLREHAGATTLEQAIAQAQQEAVDLADAWDRANRSGRNVSWQGGAAESTQDFAGVEGDFTPAHGMSKSATLSEALRDLHAMVWGSLDGEQTLYWAGLTNNAGVNSGGVIGAGGGHAYRDGPFIIIFRDGVDSKNPTSDDIVAVLVNPAHSELVAPLQAMFPHLTIADYHGVENVVNEEARAAAMAEEAGATTLEQRPDRADITQVASALQKDGWTESHRSTKDGVVTSYYFDPPRGLENEYGEPMGEIRISDHELGRTVYGEEQGGQWEVDIKINPSRSVDDHLRAIMNEEYRETAGGLGSVGFQEWAQRKQTAEEFDTTPEALAAELAAAGGDITKTPLFKAWFGDSKVVDENGDPLVVYHGSDALADVVVFNTHTTEGTFFSDSRAVADDYSIDRVERLRGPAPRTGKVYETYLSLRNPYMTDWTEVLSDGLPSRQTLESQGYDGIIIPASASEASSDLASDERNATTYVAFEPEQIKSVDNRGTFSPTTTNIFEQAAIREHSLADAQQLLKDDIEALGLTEEQAAKISPIYRPEVAPKERLPSNREAALWLEGSFEGEAITEFTEELTPEQLDEVSTIMAAEAQLALESTGSAFDWYSGALSRALDVMQVKYPMLADDAAALQSGFGTSANARFAFTYIMAVTSQNLDVAANGVAADKAFEEMVDRVRNGVYSMPRSWGTGDKQEAMGDNFDKFGPMIEAMPGETFPEKMEALGAIFRKKQTVKEWIAQAKKAGFPYRAPGQTAMDAEVYGSSILGPKIGNGFWQNLNGNFSPLTIDLWMRRTWGRYTGKSIGNPGALPAQRRRLKAAIKRSRSRQRGDADHIEAAKANVRALEWYIEQVTALPATEYSSKKERAAELRQLKADLKAAKEIVPDLEGVKAPEPYKAAYNNDDVALVEYAKRVLAVWNVEYKRLRIKHKGKVTADMQPTWARAAKTVITNLAKPLDQVANGTQRKQIEAAGAQALAKLAERGIDLTTADLQALLWYPEKDLWGALTTELETDTDNIATIPPSPLNESYDTVFARILRSQGHVVEGTEGDAGGTGGVGAVAGSDVRSQRPGRAEGSGADRGVGARGRADGPESTLEQSAVPAFYSKALRFVEESQQGKASGSQWLATMKKAGIKEQEIAWIGLEGFLTGGNNASRPITREELAEFIQANQIVVEEVEKGAGVSTRGELSDKPEFNVTVEEERGLSVYGLTAQVSPDGRDLGFIEDHGDILLFRELEASPDYNDDAVSMAAEVQDRFSSAHSTRVKFGPDTHPSMNLPGGENPGELLLTLPLAAATKHVETARQYQQDMAAKYDIDYALLIDNDSAAWRDLRALMTAEERAREETLLRPIQATMGREPPAPMFTGGHFDEPNVLAHVRYDTRIINGVKYLFLQEVQNDWGAEARRVRNHEVNRVMRSNPGMSKKDASDLVPADYGYIDSKNAGKIEVFEPGSGRVVAAFDTNEEARQWILDQRPGDNPEMPTVEGSLPDTFQLWHVDDIVDPEGIDEAEFKPGTKYIVLDGRTDTVGEGATPEEAVADVPAMYKEGEPVRSIPVGLEATNEAYDRSVHYDYAPAGQGNVEGGQMVPDRPFKNDWPELVFRRMVRYAIETGHDNIAWITGEQTIDRYDLSQHIESLSYNPYHHHLAAINHEGQEAFEKDVDPADLDEVIGKETADKIREQIDEWEEIYGGWVVKKGDDGKWYINGNEDALKELQADGPYNSARDAHYEMEEIRSEAGQQRGIELRDQDLKVGGEWAINLYDKSLPNYARKFGKKFGAKVEDVDLGVAKPVNSVEDLNQSEVELLQDIAENHGMTGTEFLDVFQGTAEYPLLEDSERSALSEAEFINLRVALSPRGELGAVHSMTITDKMRETAMEEGFPLFQDKDDAARGNIQFFPDGKVVINLFENADFSTFLHESGHFFINTLMKIAETNEDAAADVAVMMKFAGVESMEAFKGTEAQEKLARAFEAYLREGKAPSPALEGAFARYRAWLITIYRSILKLDVEINDEIRGVFDRMLATDEEIAQAEQINNFAPMPGIAELMGDDAADYADAGQRARDRAVDILTKQKAAEDVREETERWKAEYEKIREEIAASVDAQPVYMAMDAIRDRETDLYMSKEAVVAIVGEEGARALPGGLTRVEGGYHPDLIARQFGFTSGDEMLFAMMNAAKNKDERAAIVKELATDQMNERHGSLDTNKAQAAEAATEAVMNDERGLILAMELRALALKAGREPTVAAVAKAAAKRMLAGKKYSDAIQSGKYAQASAKAGRDANRAMLAEDYDAATEAKMRQILNHYLSREARRIEDSMSGMISRMTKWKTGKLDPNKINPDFIRQARAVLDGISFGTRISQRRFDRMSSETLEAWAEQQDKKYGAKFHIPALLDAALTKTNYKDMTVEELIGLHDTVKSIIVQGRRYSDAEQAQFDSMVRKIAANVDAHAKKKVQKPRERNWIKRVGNLALQFIADHRTIQSLSDELDGYTGFPLPESFGKGSVFRSVYLRIKHADDRYTDRSMQAGMEMAKIFSVYNKREKMAFNWRKFIPALNDSLSRNARIAFALNMGNAGNVEAMENEFSQGQITAVLTTLTEKDWDVVEALWANVNQYKDELLDLEERTTGVRPEAVDAVPFLTPSGRKVTGGYYPLIADPEQTGAGRRDQVERDTLDGFKSKGHAKATTKTGAVIERVGFGKDRKVLLDVGGAFQHVDGVIRDIEMREAVVEVDKIIRHPEFERAVKEAKGDQFYQLFENYLENVVGGNKGPQTGLEKALSYSRVGASIAEMGFSLRTIMMQPYGLTQSIVMLGERNVARGVAEFAASPKQSVEAVFAMSTFMANRAATFNRDLRDANKLVGPGGMHADLVSASFSGIAMFDMAVSIPTWLAAYRKGLSEHMEQQDAVDYADTIVSRSQGTGLPRDMAEISQGQGYKRLFSMFYSFFSSYHNLQSDQWKQTDFKNPKQAVTWAKNQIWMTVIPAMLVDYLFGAGPDDPDDWVSWLKWGVGSVASFALGGIVLARSIANAVATGYGFQMTPAEGLAKHAVNTYQQIAQGENDVALWKSLIMLIGYGGHMPGARGGARAIDVVDDEGFDEADTFGFWWRLLISGKEK
jgi:hypothetical protein